MSYSLRDFLEVDWPLSVADASVKTLKARLSMPERQIDEETRHAAIVIVFTAAAVEAALNVFISRPLLNIADPAAREFFAKLLHRHSRANGPAKLEFVKHIYPKVKEQAGLLKAVQDLAAARNALIHIYPDYVVALGPKLDADWPLRDGDWVEYPDLRWTKQHLANADSAVDLYEKAIKFIDILPLSLPAYEAMCIEHDGQQAAAAED